MTALVIFGPLILVDVDGVAAHPSAQEVLQARSTARTTIVQTLGGLIVVFGAYMTWRQFLLSSRKTEEEIRLSELGRLTERMTQAVGQLGSPEPAVRVGGVYALGRIADESEHDREPIRQILAAYVRTHAAVEQRPVRLVDRLVVRRPDVQAALTVLGRGNPTPNRVSWLSLELTGTDLRRAELTNSDLRRTRFVDCLLTRADMEGADLRGCDLRRADLGTPGDDLAALRNARANMLTWWPDGFEPAAAGVLIDPGLAGADLCSADLRGRNLVGIDLSGAITNTYTIWPSGFDWRAAGVVEFDGA
ncbi:pentapeptide repeat-containing protein [Nocardia sp. KC 131]|uniref:pentapeptide repeat-containing protein n=1 Tax=Nocardia arseniciresistens TaxID=3392119 RepID=UPI00398F6E56